MPLMIVLTEMLAQEEAYRFAELIHEEDVRNSVKLLLAILGKPIEL